MEENPVTRLPETPVKRSSLLTVVCILTFAGSGLNLVSSFLVGTYFDYFSTVMAEFSEKFDIPVMEVFEASNPLYFFISALLYLVSLSGAVLMWKMKRTGFHVYTIAQILLILVPMYFFKMSGPPLLETIISGVFILLYASQMKLMS